MSKCDLIHLFVHASPRPVTPKEVWAAVGFRPHGFLDHLLKAGRICEVDSVMHVGRRGYNPNAHERRFWHRKHVPMNLQETFSLVNGSRALTAILIHLDRRNRRAMPWWMYQPEIACAVLQELPLESIARYRFRDSES